MASSNRCFQVLLLLFNLFSFIYTLIYVFIDSILYDFTQRTDDRELNDVIVQQELQKEDMISVSFPCASQIVVTVEINHVNDICELRMEQLIEVFIERSSITKIVDVLTALSNNKYNEDITVPRLEQSLICYCDGSYSQRMQIAYSGFRTSDGFSQFRLCPLRHCRRGSTESEVFAACLALQYTAMNQCKTMILCTDNSKVEQLLKCPKQKDYIDYSNFFDALNQCHRRENYVDIQIQRVRGHTTRYEQEQCTTKYEFAKVDRRVRQNVRRHVRRYYLSNKQINPSYQSNTKNMNGLHAKKYGTTFTASIPKILSYFKF